MRIVKELDAKENEDTTDLQENYNSLLEKLESMQGWPRPP